MLCGGGGTVTAGGGGNAGGGGDEGDLDLLRDDDGKSDGGGEGGDTSDGGNGITCPYQRTISELIGLTRKVVTSSSESDRMINGMSTLVTKDEGNDGVELSYV
nr:hypothetical protein [Tanacetum cinerariifolium]